MMIRRWKNTERHIRVRLRLQRYKGLGEMDAEQLWETTLNPETQTVETGRDRGCAYWLPDVTEMLMGTDVPPRKAFIYEHAAGCRA